MDTDTMTKPPKSAGPTYSAPALEKGLDILEMLCRSNIPLSQTEIAEKLGRSIGEIYRMLTCLVNRNYILNNNEMYVVTTKLFELAHANPPTNRLLAEAAPLMQELSSELNQASHLTVYNQGRQVVIAKVDNPGGLGFSVRVGGELDVLVSASGRALLAFLDPETAEHRIRESVQRRPEHASVKIKQVLEAVRKRGFESIVSAQIKGLYAVSYPILDTRNYAIAALTVAYAERIDQPNLKSIPEVEVALGKAAKTLSQRMGWREPSPKETTSQVLHTSETQKRVRRK
ncbi:IclR family transcriptional regulator [Xanthobacter autotrophicus]|uniref:IclR family transcriptional regulator n=1 Tax=Xanthobacter autotrophicus TaxID=280 RepID=UPI00372BCCD3